MLIGFAADSDSGNVLLSNYTEDNFGEDSSNWNYKVLDNVFQGNVGIGKTNPENPLHIKTDDADKPSPIRLESIIGSNNIAVEICVYHEDPDDHIEAPRGSLCIVPFSYGNPPKLYMNHSDSGIGKEWGLLAETQE